MINKRKEPFIQTIKKHFGTASFFSKYVIIGGGFAGYALSHLMTSVRVNLILETIRD